MDYLLMLICLKQIAVSSKTSFVSDEQQARTVILYKSYSLFAGSIFQVLKHVGKSKTIVFFAYASMFIFDTLTHQPVCPLRFCSSCCKFGTFVYVYSKRKEKKNILCPNVQHNIIKSIKFSYKKIPKSKRYQENKPM